MRDPYKALNVDPKASDADIKKAYRKLAKEYHPDRNQGNKAKEDRFKEISAAYDILSDPQKRAQFDSASRGGGIPAGDLSEIFAQMFGGGRGGGSPFSGMGGSPFSGMGGGSPFGGSPFSGMGGMPRQARQQRRPAPKPQAKEKKRKASDGSVLTQRGANIYSDLRLPFDQAILGCVANVPTLTGMAKVRIPPGTSSGVKLRLKGKGEKSSSPKQAQGDHFVSVQIDVPKVEGTKSRDLLAKFVKSISKENP